MIAEIKKKSPTECANSEDELTGNFFGTLRYTKFHSILAKILTKSTFRDENQKDSFTQLVNKSDITYFSDNIEFWPKKDDGEIDIRINLPDICIGIEVKYKSGLSSDDQLAKYSRMKIGALILLAMEPDAYEIYAAECKKGEVEPDVLFGYISWEEIFDIIEELLKGNIDYPEKVILTDLWDLFKIKGLYRFEKFELDDKYLFSWENVPGTGTDSLLEFLLNDFNIGGASKPEIRKSNDDKIISIANDTDSAEILISDDKGKAILKISDGETYDLTVKNENDKLKIYKSNYEKSAELFMRGLDKSANKYGFVPLPGFKSALSDKKEGYVSEKGRKLPVLIKVYQREEDEYVYVVAIYFDIALPEIDRHLVIIGKYVFDSEKRPEKFINAFWRYYWPIQRHRENEFKFPPDEGEYYYSEPKDEKASENYQDIKETVFKEIDLLEVNKDNIKGKIFDELNKMQKL